MAQPAPHYILVASAGVTIPQINIIVNAIDDDTAKGEATRIALALHPNYFGFDLFDVRGPLDKHVCRVSVASSAPVATIR